MPRQSRSRTKESSDHEPRLLQQEEKKNAIDSWLEKHRSYFPEKAPLTTDEFMQWHRDVMPFSLAAIDWAFDAHRRLGKFFPKYGDILDLLVTWEAPDAFANTSTCDAICRARHGKGYGYRDMQTLFQLVVGEHPKYFHNAMPRWNRTLVQARALAGSNAQSVVVIQPNRAERTMSLDDLLNKLDSIRGRVPEWRKPDATADTD